MERTAKPKPKLVDLFHKWLIAQTKAKSLSGKMSITPSALKAEEEAYTEFYEALKKCNC